METFDIIPKEYDYPVFNNMGTVSENIKAIVPVFKGIYPNPGEHLALVVRGTSGIVLATELVRNLPDYVNLKIRFLRKDGERSHGLSQSYVTPGFKVVVIDDFIASGATMETIAKELDESNGSDGSSRVETVIAKAMYDNLDYKNGEEFLPKVFPNIKYLIR